MTQIAPLTHRCLIRVCGPDAVNFLGGLLTLNTDVVARDTLHCHYGAFLRPQGKLFADIIAHAPEVETLWLDVNAETASEVLTKLKMYRLRAKAEIEALELPVCVAFDGPLPEGFVRDARSDVIGAEFGFGYGAFAPTATADAWVNWRLGHGLSDPGYDFAADQLYAIEANLDLLGGIDFKKGCYIGQELTSRMKRRGPVKNRLLSFVYSDDTPENDAEILNGDMRAGRVTIAHEGHGLGLMRLDRSAGALATEVGAITLSLPDWLQANVTLGSTEDAE